MTWRPNHTRITTVRSTNTSSNAMSKCILMQCYQNALNCLGYPQVQFVITSRKWNSAGKKTSKYQERNHFNRGKYLRQYRQLIKDNGKQHIVHVDECGFEPTTCRQYGWSARGQKVHGEVSGNSRPRTTLIAARHKNRLIAPILFEGSTNANVFNYWLQHHLFRELPKQTTIIVDNASFHKTAATRDIIHDSGNSLLYLPAYSPDLNPIEQDFAIIKKRWQYAPKNTTVDYIIKMYNS